ncbi:hypothetical protein, partial [Dyella sp.]|uniref:hypothetical protein n=1 Tax=Dyella sp. TaxID=1869338 RepID=UPI003217FFEC
MKFPGDYREIVIASLLRAKPSIPAHDEAMHLHYSIRNSRISTTGYWGIMLAEGFSGLKLLNCTIVGVVGQGADNG